MGVFSIPAWNELDEGGIGALGLVAWVASSACTMLTTVLQKRV